MLRDPVQYDTMPTEALEALLREDAALPDSAPRDMDAIFKIMEVLARREREAPSGEITDVDTAWARFQADYLPRIDSMDPAFDPAPSVAEQDPRCSPAAASRVRKRFGLRIASVAAVFVLCLFAGTATASAFGFDFWNTIVRWTGETFGFLESIGRADTPEVIPDVLQTLQQTLLKNGFEPSDIVPTYLPDGFEQGETTTSTSDYCTSVVCRVMDGTNYIILQYRVYSEPWADAIYEKDMADPEIYEVNGIPHYITTNMEQYQVLWRSGLIECGIYGVIAKDDVYRMIDSIYGGSQ